MFFHRKNPAESRFSHSFPPAFRLFAVTFALLFALIPASYIKAEVPPNYPLMAVTAEEKVLQNQEALNSPLAEIDQNLRKELASGLEGSSLSLLSRLSYIPSQRDQGLNGSCWVWAGTGIMEIALSAQRGINVRLSTQYLISNYNGGSGPNWAGAGGSATLFANFYSGKRIVIPWSNLNANYQDGSSTTGTKVPASSIVTVPNYPFTSITASRISTWGMTNAAAILNIKTLLNQNKALYFGFYLANKTDWDLFNSFWKYQIESNIWSGGFSDGKYYNEATGGGHAVLCVGYDDSDPDPAKHYWIMLNSWGVPAGRPAGLFRIPMEYNYSVTDSDGSYNTQWWTVNPVYAAVSDKAATTPSIPSAVLNPKSSVPGYWSNN